MVDFMQAHPRLTLAAIAALWALCYLVACAIWPFANCMFCDGRGRKYQNESRKTWRPCRWCKGSGSRRRVGRAIWAKFRESKRRATK